MVAHLGNGDSVTAVLNGQSIDTSMGFTPLEGLVMGSRSGHLDPSVPLFLLREGMDTDAIEEMLNLHSGLKALAGTGDMRSVQEAAEAGGERAARALDIAAYRLAKYLGAYHVAVGGAQAFVFTAGVGEHSWQFRARMVGKLGALNVNLDEDANRAPSENARIISSADSAIAVLVIPTDEDRAIAEATAAVLTDQPSGPGNYADPAD